jgi:hypothetical protein
MAASEHLHPTLFHGTGAFLPEGGVIHPTHQFGSKEDLAFSSDSLTEAQQYAYPHTVKWNKQLFAPVYEVEPVDKDEELIKRPSSMWKDATHHISKKGFRVKKTHYVYWND